MEFNFDWNYISAGAPYVTISSLGLAFNSPAINMLGKPENVVVGFDEKAMAIGIREAKESEISKSYKFNSRVKNGWVRIGCKDFVKYLAEISGTNFAPAKKYIAKYNADEKILFITVLERNNEKEDASDNN